MVDEEQKVRVLEGECVEIMNGLPSGSVDAIITDPPYSMPATYYVTRDRNDTPKRWSDTLIMQSWFKLVVAQMVRLLKPDGNMVVFCNALSLAAFAPSIYPHFNRFTSLVWDKGSVGLGMPFRKQHELMIFAANSKGSIREDTNLSDVLVVPRLHTSRKSHPAEKPVDLLAPIIRNICPEDGVVLDPFAGSGSVGQAALQTNRRAILIEYDTADIIRMKSKHCKLDENE